MLLTKESIVAVNDARYSVINVPEWGGDVRVRSLYGSEKSELRLKGEAAPSWDAYVCAFGIVDEKGMNLFSPAETAILAKKHPGVLEKLAAEILTLSQLTQEARSDAEKKQTPTPTSDGGTSSPEPSTQVTG